MQPNLKPEAVDALRQMIDHSRELSKAMAAITKLAPHEFSGHPGREFIDRSQAMDQLLAIRDAHYRLCECARQSVIDLGVATDGGDDAREP